MSRLQRRHFKSFIRAVLTGALLVKPLFLCLIVLTAPMARSQETKSGPVGSLTDTLRRHHVGASPEELIAALNSDVDEVRAAAAYQLMLTYGPEAIPYLMHEIPAETNGPNRIHLEAYAAALGDASGLRLLKADCFEKKRLDLRLTAADDMLHLVHRQDCLPAVIDVVGREHVDPPAVVAGLNLLLNYHAEDTTAPQQVPVVVSKQLKSNDPGIRMTAAAVLQRLGTVQQAPSLRKAIAAETDDGVRKVMLLALQSIEVRTERSQ